MCGIELDLGIKCDFSAEFFLIVLTFSLSIFVPNLIFRRKKKSWDYPSKA